MGDHTKKQHYVPQFSLRYFSAEGKGTQIYVYDKLRGESRLQSIRDVAHSNYFYNYVTESKKPATLEKDLARLEADAAKIIAQVVADESLARLGDDDRHVLAQQERKKTTQHEITNANSILRILRKTSVRLDEDRVTELERALKAREGDTQHGLDLPEEVLREWQEFVRSARA